MWKSSQLCWWLAMRLLGEDLIWYIEVYAYTGASLLVSCQRSPELGDRIQLPSQRCLVLLEMSSCISPSLPCCSRVSWHTCLISITSVGLPSVTRLSEIAIYAQVKRDLCLQSQKKSPDNRFISSKWEINVGERQRFKTCYFCQRLCVRIARRAFLWWFWHFCEGW